MKLADGRVVETDQVIRFPGWRYNAYECPFGHALLSLDVDEGVTPASVACPDHDGTMSWSRFYRLAPEVYLPVRMIWRRATASETKRWKRKDPAMYEHVRLGGLVREWVPVEVTRG